MQNTRIKVAIQGDRASFHEIAALQYYTQPTQLTYCRSFDEVFTLLSQGKVDKAFVAVRNSRHGEIDEVKVLMDAHSVVAEGEYLLPINQHLVGVPGSRLNDVRKIISHPVALSQCADYLARQFKDAELEDYHDTSAAIAYVKQLSDSSIAAIGSDMAAEMHGLVILEHAIQDDPSNVTLFKSLAARERPVKLPRKMKANQLASGVW